MDDVRLALVLAALLIEPLVHKHRPRPFLVCLARSWRLGVLDLRVVVSPPRCGELRHADRSPCLPAELGWPPRFGVRWVLTVPSAKPFAVSISRIYFVCGIVMQI